MAIKQLWSVPSALALSLALAAPAIAQETAIAQQAADESQGLSEIIVTATRRETDLQVTPIAISAIDQSIIQQSSPDNIGDLASFVPNFSAARITGFNAASFAMRGVGQNNIIVYFEPSVLVLIDDFVVPSVQTQLLDTFDIEQVEVLRGPQGTLFGKNAIGGVVNVRTRKPDLDGISVEVRGVAGSFKTAGVNAAVNVPLIADKLALRIVGGYEYSDGFMRNGACWGPVGTFVPDPVPASTAKWVGRSGCGDGRRVGGTDVFNIRAKALFKPVDNVELLVQYEMLRDRSESPAPVNETPVADPARFFLLDALGVGSAANRFRDPIRNGGLTNRAGALLRMDDGHRVDVDGIYANLNVDLEIGTWTTILGQRKQKSRLPSTYSGNAPTAADGSVLSLFDATRDDDRKTTQFETRFATDFGGSFDLVAGAFYQRDNVDFCVSQILGFLDLTSGPLPFGAWNDTPYLLCNAQKARSAAFFAEGTFKATDKLTITVGGRYTSEKKTWRGRQQAFIPTLNGGFDPSIQINRPLDASVYNFTDGVVTVQAKDNEPTYRISLAYEANDDIFLYATYSRGFKGGGFNDQIGGFAPFGTDLAAFAAAASATKPEKADSYEAGIKTEFWDNRGRFNLTGFWVDYSNLQKQIVVPITVNGQPNQVTRFFNAASARVKGIEAEATVMAAEGLTLRGVMGYQDAGYLDYVTPIPAGYNLADAPLDRAPKWQWAIDGTYAVPLNESLKVSLNGNVNYTGRNLFTQSISDARDNTFLRARTLLNASITLSDIDDRYWIRAVGKNLSDERYETASQVVGGLWTFTLYGPPRYFGIELGIKFGQ
ncbi:MAG: TonB-dependent receptor [Sandarakinorhabdus sp.]|nr:TonB-dependent receptor [Sandarakinorhabdus sp.]